MFDQQKDTVNRALEVILEEKEFWETFPEEPVSDDVIVLLCEKKSPGLPLQYEMLVGLPLPPQHLHMSWVKISLNAQTRTSSPYGSWENMISIPDPKTFIRWWFATDWDEFFTKYATASIPPPPDLVNFWESINPKYTLQ